MKKITLYSLLVLSLILIFDNCKVLRKNTLIEPSYSFENVLTDYGEAIYKREECSKCHTQQIENENTTLVSLDGIGGYYPNSWLYHLLFDPSLVIPQSKMPSYSHIHNNSLDKMYMQKYLKGHLKNKNFDTIWGELVSQADEVSAGLTERDILVEKRTEVLALIAYLQKIPSSKSKLKKDSIENVIEMNNQMVFDNITLDSNSVVFKVTNNSESIDKGQLLYDSHCLVCHGKKGIGNAIGPNLADDYWKHGGRKIDIARIIIDGVIEKGMLSYRNMLSPNDVGCLVAYILALKETKN